MILPVTQRVGRLLLLVVLAVACGAPQAVEDNAPPARITRVEMQLSAFGVESDDFPSIDARLDFDKESGVCRKTYYNPAYKPLVYTLSPAQLRKIRQLLQAADMARLKLHCATGKTDQPTSTTIIYTTGRKFTIKDYGLVGDAPLPELYKLVYRY